MDNTTLTKTADGIIDRDCVPTVGKWNMPAIKKQDIDLTDLSMITYADTKTNESAMYKDCGVLFFVKDSKFQGVYNNPQRYLKKLKQYRFLLTPDNSVYIDMKNWLKMESIAHSRWCGAYWQANGCKVVPTVTWGDVSTYEYCFDGLEEGSIVAISTLKARKCRREFIRGYNELLERVNPSTILCYGEPFEEMEGNIIVIEYNNNRKEKICYGWTRNVC